MSVNAEQSARRLKSLYDHWKANPEAWGNAASFIVANGPANKSEDEISYRKPTAFQMRLFEYELPDTIMLMTQTEVHVVTTAKKLEFLKPVAEPWKTEAGVTLKMHERPKGGDGKDQILALIDAAKAAGSPCGHVNWEESTGDFCALLKQLLESSGVELFDCTASLAMAMAPKDKEEVMEMKRAALLCTQTLEKSILQKIEDVVDSGKKIKHSQLASEAEAHALDPVKPPLEVKLRAENVAIALPFLVQSGGEYEFRMGRAACNDEKLYYDPIGVIVCILGIKYKSYCSLIGRSYLINPTDKMTKAYEALLKAHQAAIAAATDGAKLSSIYEAARTSLNESDPELVGHLPKSIGHVIGLELREGQMVLNAKGERCVQAGTVLHVCTALNGLVNESGKSDKEKNFSLYIGDCVLVTKAAAEVITSKAKVSYADISYVINEDGEDDEKEEVKKEEEALRPRTKGASAVLDAKTRGEAGREEQEAIRKQKQEELAKRKNAETLARLTEQSQRANAAASTSQAVAEINAFRSPADIVPQRSREGMIVVDDARDAVLLPIYGALVPFHAGTIKNAQLVTGESRFSIIRISFNVPGQSFGAGGWPPALANPNCTFIRELSFRSPDARHAEEVTMGIKNLVKTVKQRESERRERSLLVTQEKLRTRKGRPLTLREVWMRPTAARVGKGRKTPGTLECHDNGFRYTNPREESVDIIFANIKHAIIQTGGKREVMTLVHFHLHNPIMVGKKKTTDVQFFTEVVEAVQNVDGARRSMLDPEELEEEQRERERRNRINKEYKGFCKSVQDQWEKEHPQLELEWDAPFEQLGFQGVPFKSQSWIYPTVNCLVDLVETPFFVLTLKDVEIVNLERVSFGIRNFDMAIVFKDFNREVHKITSIDVKFLDGVKEWMTRIGVKYYESKMNLNWKPILKTILDDPQDFIANGGWEFLNLEQTDSEDEQEEESDAYEPTESEDESEDDSDDSSMVDSDEEDSSDGSGDDDDEEEEGKDWDELEREAMEEDEDASESDSEERRARKRKAAGKGAGPPPKKSKGAPPPAAKKPGKK